MHDIFKNLEIGIGEVSKLTGVSQRQLRYWETKATLSRFQMIKVVCAAII